MGVYPQYNKRLRCQVYYIDYYVHGKRVRECVGPISKSAALKILAKKKFEVEEGLYLGKKSEMAFSKMMDEFLNLYSKANNKETSYKRYVVSSKQLLKFFGKKTISQVSIKSIEEYKVLRSRYVKPASVNRELALLRAMFNKAIEWGYVRENPVSKVKKYREPERIRYLSQAELKRLFDVLLKPNKKAPHIKPIVILALYTGMRRGEILNLRWTQIDFDNRMILLETSKSGKRRTIELCDTAYNALAFLPKKGRYVFQNKLTGKPITDIKNAFHAIIKKTKIEDFRFHDLRHTFASYLTMRGENTFTIQQLLGHSTLEMAKRYSHLNRDKERVAMGHHGEYMDTLLRGHESPKIEGFENGMDTVVDKTGKNVGHA
jgi:integrase